jgi:lysyl-tRNA synthetase class 1
MPPDALRMMMLGRDPARALELDLRGGFPRFMDEYRASTQEDPVPFTHLVTVAQTVGTDAQAAATMLRRGGYERAAEDRKRLDEELRYARNWAEEWAPEAQRLRLLEPEEALASASGLDDDQRQYLRELSGRLRPDLDGDAVQDLLYSTAVERDLKPKRAFAAIYTVLLGKTSGPKAGPFIAGLPVETVRERFAV